MQFIIDGMNIAFRSHHVYDVQQGLKSSTGLPTGLVYGFLRTLMKWRKAYPEHTFTVAWDAVDGNEMRRSIYPPYKGNRNRVFEEVSLPEDFGEVIVVEDSGEGAPTIDAFTFQLEMLQKILSSMGVHQVCVQGYEADDVIATLVRQTYKEANHVILTSDRDMLQLVNRKTIVMTPEGKPYDTDKVVSQYGVTPELLLPLRALQGDKSDNLPGLFRFRSKVMAQLVNENSGSLESIYNTGIERGLTPKELEKILAFKDQAFINREVMSLRIIPQIGTNEGVWSESQIKGMCELLELNSLVEILLKYPEGRRNQGFLRFDS